MNPRDPSLDKASIAKIVAGESSRAQGIEELYSKYRTPLMNFFKRSGLDAMLAEDLLQDVFIRITRAASEFRGEAKPSTWIWSIAMNRLHDHYRGARPEVLLDDDGWTVLENSVEQPERPNEHRLEDCVRQAFVRFARTAGLRAEVLRRVTIDGLSIESAALLLGRTASATKEFLSQTRKKLRPYLEECRELIAD